MKKVIVSLIISALIVSSCKISKDVENVKVIKEVNYIPYYLKVYEADSLYLTRNYVRSFNILDSLFKVFTPVNSYKVDEFATYCKLKILLNKKSIEKDFSLLISKYGYNKIWIDSDSILRSYLVSNNKLNENYFYLRKKYLNQIDLELRKKIELLVIDDQKYRIEKKTIQTQKLRKQTDSINEISLVQIFNTYGYPNADKIGNYTIDEKNISIDVLLYHTSTSKNKDYFLNKVLEYVKYGKADPEVYAIMVDRLNMFTNETQVYGTYQSNLKESITEVNKERRTIGLPSLNYQDWKVKILYPDINLNH